MAYEPTIVYDRQGYASLTPAGIAKGVQVVRVNNPRNAGGAYERGWYPYPFRIVLHEIQGGANPGSIAGHPYPPQVWYDSIRRILYQTVPIGRSGYALYQDPNAPHYTNKACALQVELSGFTEGVANEPKQVLDNIAEDVVVPLCVWADEQGSPINPLDLPPYPWVIANSARSNAPQRYTVDRWANTNGMLTHANVPMGDDHWDTGAMDIVWIGTHAALCIGAILTGKDPFPQPTGDDDNMPDLILQDSEGTQFGCFRSGSVRRMLGPEVAYWQSKGIKVEVLATNWTQYMKEHVRVEHP